MQARLHTDTLRRLPFYLAAAIIVIAIIVLAGWQFDIAFMRRPLPHSVSMNPVTAFVFVLCGTYVMLLQLNTERTWFLTAALNILAALTAMVGLLRLTELTGYGNYGIDRLLYTHKLILEPEGFNANRMAPNTAFGFILTGSAFALAGFKGRQPRRLAGIFLSVVMVVGFFSCLGYLYQVKEFYSVMDRLPMSILTAVCFILISLAILCIEGYSDIVKAFTSPYSGGKLARKLVPAIVLVPVLLGFASLQLFSYKQVNLDVGVAALITSIVIVLFVLTWLLAAALNKSDAARTAAEGQLNEFNRNLEATVSERTRQLEASETKFRHVLESMIEGIQIIDFNWRYVYVNDALVAQARFSRQQLSGFTMMEKYPGIENTPMFQILKKCMHDRTSHYIEHEFVYPDGSMAYFELSINPIPEGIFILSIDVTEQKLSREKILKANRSYAFTSAINQSIVHINNEPELVEKACNTAIDIGRYKLAWAGMLDCGGRLNIASWQGQKGDNNAPARYQGLNYNSPELRYTLAGRVLNTGQYAVANNTAGEPGALGWMEKLTGDDIGSGIAFPVKKFGKTTGVLVFYSGVKNFFDEPEVALLAEAAGDISFALEIFDKEKMRRLAEAEIKSLNESLEEKVKQRTVELQEANKELETFSYTIAHDLQAPLRSLSGFSAILLSEYANKLDSEGKNFLDIVIKSSGRMSEMIRDLLHFSKLGREQLNKRAVNMNELSGVIIDEIKQGIKNPNTEIILYSMKPCYGDPGLIRQVLANLIGNAVKYSSKKENPVIEIGMEEMNNEQVYFVKDNGAGFDMQYAGKLFDVFHRMHKNDEFEGNGVGLATVHRIIKKHGGRVWAEAKKDEGAAFYFTAGGCNQSEKPETVTAFY